jgi:hypothetical protein
LVITYLAVVTRIAWMAYHDPHHNWDTLVYMALILELQADDHSQIHTRVYDEFKKAIPEATFNSYTNPNDTVFAGKVYKDPNGFFHFASLFKTKPLYNFSSWLLYNSGVPLVVAPLVPSILSFVGIALLLMYWMNKILPIGFAFLAGLSIVLSGPLIEVARLATPDALSAFMLLLAFYLLFIRSKWYWIALALSVAILTRLDNLIIASLIILFLRVAPERTGIISKPSWVSFVMIAVGWFVYALVILNYADYEYSSANFYSELYSKANPVLLVGGALRGLPTVQHNSLSIPIALAAIMLFYDGDLNWRSFGLNHCLFVVLMIQIAVKYLLFPVLWDRLYVATFVILLLLILDRFAILFRKPIHP